MFNWNRRTWGGLLSLLLLPSAALAGGDEPQTYSSLFYGETNFANKDRDYYATIISALDGDIGKDGILFRVEGSLNNFDYNELLNAAQTKIDGTEWRGAASVGYQIVRDDIYYEVYAGLDYQSVNLSPNDLSNAVRGERAGAKVTAIIVSGESRPYYIDFASNYSTAFDTYFVRLRAGLKTGPGSALSQFAMGPEGTVFGDSGFDAQRLGLFLKLPIPLKPLDTVNVIAAGGYQWVTYNGDQSAAGGLGGGNGGYATLSFLLAF